MKKHANLSIFVPHKGCPRRCIFCDQNSISGTVNEPTAEYVSALCNKFLPAEGEGAKTEIAFFGGSFTAIERGYMTRLLEAAEPFVRSGRAKGIRISTRPDAIDGETLSVLRDFGVTSIELGAQSMDDTVLAKNLRGHTADDSRRAAALIRNYGFSLGLQMMIGMYSDTDPMSTAIFTADEFITLRPDTVRIYPTLVIENTPLCTLWRRGEYMPLSVEQAVKITSILLIKFDEQGIDVIRTGLHSDMSLQNSYIAGPFHPAFGDMCISEALMQKLMPQLDGMPEGDVTVYVAKGRTGAAVGQHRCNIISLAERGYDVTVREDAALAPFEVRAIHN